MLSERSDFILNLLLENRFVSLDELTSLLGVSTKTIKNSLNEIDSFLLNHGFSNLNKKSIVRYSIDDSVEEIKNQLDREDRVEKIFWEEPDFRQAFLFHTLFWKENRITVELLEENLFVSRSTVNNDIKNLKSKLKNWNLKIIFEKKNGFFIVGPEADQRDAYFFFINDLNNTINIEFPDEDEQFLNYWLTSLEKKIGIVLTYQSFRNCLFKLKVIIKRIKQKYTIPSEYSIIANNPNSSIRYSAERNLLAAFFNIRISLNEFAFLFRQIQSSTILKNEVVTDGYKFDLNIFVNKLIKEISDKLNINLMDSTKLHEQLALHFQGTLSSRYEEVVDLITEETLLQIINMYPKIYNIIEASMIKNTSPELSILINKKEYSFITLHIVSAIEELKNKIEESLKVVVVCHMGIGTSQFLKSRLAHHFKFSAKIEDRINKELHSEDNDLIISTIFLEDMKDNYVKVSPYLNEVDYRIIKDTINNIVEKKLKSLKQKGIYEPMLDELLNADTIDINVRVNSWKEAVQYGGCLLEKNHSIDANYTKQMVEAVKKYGPYIVIAPGVALAHASSKDGVKKIGMSLITLDKGVNFGNPENDPVNIVICLAAVDHNTHLKALSELVSLLDDKDFVNMLLSSDKATILKKINKN